MSIKPIVSVIIPVYNAEKHLRECLDSVVNQTLKDIEIICVDDGSTDGSYSILEEYKTLDPRIRVLRQKNSYAGTARNRGMSMAQGKYIAFLDSDDCFELDALEYLFSVAETHSAEMVKASFFLFHDGENRKCYTTRYSENSCVEEKWRNHPVRFSDCPDQLVYVADVPWNGLYQRKFLEKNGICFNSLRCVNDHSFFIWCLLDAARIVVVSKKTAFYRVGQENSLVSIRADHYSNQIESIKIVKELCKDQTIEIKRIILQRELDALIGWFDKISSSKQQKNPEIEQQLFPFLTQLRDYEAGWQFFDSFRYEELYRKLRDKAFRKESKVKVSFIVPVYNTEAYLDECLRSLCRQTLKEIEIICVDDCSSDHSLDKLYSIAAKDDRIKVLAHSENKSQGGARNAGLNVATGRYVWMIDSDDYIDCTSAEVLFDKMEQFPEVDVISFNADAFFEVDGKRSVSPQGAIVRKWPSNQVIRLPEDASCLPAQIEGSSVTFFSRRSCIDRYRYRENVAFEDADFSFLVFTGKGAFYHLDYAPYHRRITEGSTTGQLAAGENERCIYGRIIAAKEISSIIDQRNLPRDSYAVKWFVAWMRFATRLFLARPEKDNQEICEVVRKMQNKWQYMEWREIRDNRKVFIPRVVVSLTSYPARIQFVHKAIDSISSQSITPDEIRLYLAENQFEEGMRSVSSDLIKRTKETPCFSIHFCPEDIKPHKKYYYVMQECRDAVIITMDDDVEYPENTIERLLESFVRFPHAVSCLRGHSIKMYDCETFAPYSKWIVAEKKIGIPSYGSFATGVGGVLYPPESIPPEAFNLERIKRDCLFADDLWLKWMELKNDVPCIILSDENNPENIEGSQSTALWVNNVRKKGNDIAWHRIIDEDNCLDKNGNPILNKLFRECEIELPEKRVDQPSSNSAEIAFYKMEIEGIHNSASYKIGRLITWPARKIRSIIQHSKTYERY